MAGIRHEFHHYTPAQVREHLDEALAIMRERDLDPYQHIDVLVAVYNSLAAKNIQVEEVRPASPYVFPFGDPS